MELPEPDLTIFLHMHYKAIADLRGNRKFLDANEKSETHLKEAEKSYLNLVGRFGWKYIKCLKTEDYTSKSDIRTEKDINDELFALVKAILRDGKNPTRRMTRFF